MTTLLLTLVSLSLVLWVVTLCLPWRPWWNGQTLESDRRGSSPLDELTVLIPARNEADVISQTLGALVDQGSGLRVILVDDGSTDGTADVARTVSGLSLQILSGVPLPNGWSGKLWALEQGIQQVETTYTLLLDADILLGDGMAARLLDKAKSDGRQFVSIMASLRMRSFWEKLLMPAFIYFFKLLYPFEMANSANRRFFAAAGGCILLETRLIREIGGFASIRGALIDDCALAKRVKSLGARLWVGQSRSVISLREYNELETIWDMVARTAFTQLRYSAVLLAFCTALMVMAFWIPVIGLLCKDIQLFQIASLAFLGMAMTYLPTLRYYGLSNAWILALPVTASLYLAMTWSSALRFWRGERSRWKSRVYATETES